MMQNAPGKRRADRGFTLLEVLIATAVSAIVLVAISGTYFGALRLHNATVASVDTNLVLERSLALVRSDLEGLMLPGSPTATPPIGTFSGQFQDTPTESLTQDFTNVRVSPDFYTTSGTLDGWNPFSEVEIVAYFLAPSTEGNGVKNLIRAVTRNLLPAQTPTTDEQVVLGGVVGAEFNYYDGSEWTNTWDSTQTQTLPAAIQFSLTLASASRNAQPIQLVVPVLPVTKTSETANLSQSPGGAAL